MAGEDFEAVVQAVSESPTKANGGKIGPINVTDLNPALAQEIEKLQPGQASAPVRAARGYQVLKLETRSEPELLPMDRVRPQIERRIREARLGEETQKLLRRLRTQAVIEWKDDALKKTYEDALAAAGQRS
jgi:parvulin-like peptidyl-prolyl isomerase